MLWREEFSVILSVQQFPFFLIWQRGITGQWTWTVKKQRFCTAIPQHHSSLKQPSYTTHMEFYMCCKMQWLHVRALIYLLFISYILPSVLWHCSLGVRKSIRPVKIEWWGVDVVICLERGAFVCIWSSWCHCLPKTIIVIISCLI